MAESLRSVSAWRKIAVDYGPRHTLQSWSLSSRRRAQEMTLRDQILEAIDSPGQLEALYRRGPGEFARVFPEAAPGFRDSRSLAPEAVLRTTAVTEPPCRAGRESSRLLSPHRGSCTTTLVSSSERTHLLRSKGGSRAIFPLIPCGALSWHSRSRSHLASNKPKSFSHGDTETQCLRGSVVRSSGFSLLGHGAA